MKLQKPTFTIVLLLCSLFSLAQTSWRGTVSTAWDNPSNWTSGIPTSTTDAIIGDANFTGSNQPTINVNAACRSLILGGSVASTLTVNKNLTITMNLTINGNGSLVENKTTITVGGDWINNGSYSANSNNSMVILNGTIQKLGGTSNTTFRKLRINSGSITTLTSNIAVNGNGAQLTVAGTINPNESPSYILTTASGATTITSSGTLKVNATTFSGNYNLGTFYVHQGFTIDYSSTTVNQTINHNIVYSNLRISGSGTKSLGDITTINGSSTSVGNVDVASGILNLSNFTLDRQNTTIGGSFSVANGATVRVGGVNNFPVNYADVSLSMNSNVEYYANNQTVAARTYGNLSLTGTSGTVVKTMPGTAFTVAGNFTSSVGTASSLSYTAESNITFSGNVAIGTSTSFNGGSFSHTIAGNLSNAGTLNGNSGSITIAGAKTVISGTGTYNFNNLSFSGAGITASSNNITVGGNLSSTGSGTFTHNDGGTLVMSGAAKVFSGSGFRFNNLTITGSTTSSNSFVVNGNLSVPGTLNSTGTVELAGAAKIISGAGSKSFSRLIISGSITTAESFNISSLLDVNGSFAASAGIATFTGNSVLNGVANLFNAVLNGTSLQLATNAVLGVANSFSITAGSLNVSSSIPNTIHYNGTGNQNILPITYHNLTLSGGNTKSATGSITTNGNIAIETATTFNASSFTHTIRGNWRSNGIFAQSSSTIIFRGTSDASLSGTTNFNIIEVDKSGGKALSLLNNISVVTINMTAGILRTGTNEITITNTRNGSGVILGTIRRTHAFSPGVAYAFESPFNTITFSSVSSVSSVIVKVNVGIVSTFPFGASINRQYDINIPTGSYNANLKLHYEEGELNGNDESIMQMWNWNGTSWTALGASSRDLSNNYVELDNVTNVSNKWTLSEYAYVVRWNGSQSSNWNDPLNWTVVEGSPGMPPASTDIVEVGTSPFTHDPVINTPVTIKGIVFGSAKASNLHLAEGGTLSTNGNIVGRWTANATHNINVGSQNLNVNGMLDLSDGAEGRAINLHIGTGSVTVNSSVNHSGDAIINFNGNGQLNIGGMYHYTSGLFSAGNGTVVYNGDEEQLIAGLIYNNLSIAKPAGEASISDNVTVNGNLIVSSGTLDIDAEASVHGNINISTGAVVDGNNATINIGGSWSNSGTFLPDNSTVTFNGTSSQTIDASTFNNIIVNNSTGVVSLISNLVINGSLKVNAGTLDLSTFSANGSSSGNDFTLSNGTTLLVTGAANFPNNFTTYAIGASSLVHYNGTVAQSVKGVSYGNLHFSNGGSNSKELAADVSVIGDIAINNGATLASGPYALNLHGSWINNGNFLPATGTVVLNGSGKTISGSTVFNNVIYSGGYTITSAAITYNGNLHVTGNGSINSGSSAAIVNKDMIIDGTIISSGPTTFTGDVHQTIRLTGNFSATSSAVTNFNGTVPPTFNSTKIPLFANLNINNSGGIYPSVGWTVVVAMNISNGAAFHGGGHSHIFKGSFSNDGIVTSSGVLNFVPEAASVNIKLSGTEFRSTGTVNFGGTSAIAIIGAPTTLTDVTISNTNASGITPSSNWSIGRDLSISADAILNLGGYNYTVGGDVESDGVMNGGTSTVTMTASAGSITASANSAFNHLTINAGAVVHIESGVKVAGNFLNNGTFNASEGTLIMTGSNAASINSAASAILLNNLSIEKSANAVVTLLKNITEMQRLQLTSGIFDIGSFTLTEDPASPGAFVAENGATLKIGGSNSLPSFNSYDLSSLSTIEYAGTTQSVSAATSYGNLSLTSAGTKTAAAALTIRNNLSISNATFNAGGFTHLLGGHWNMSSGNITNGGTIVFNGSADQSIASTAPFNNITINKTSSVVALSSAITVNGNVTFSAGRISLGSHNLTLSSTSAISGANATRYFITGSTGSLVQPITAGNSKLYPVGIALHYLPATVALNASSVSDNIHVRVQNVVYKNGTSGSAVTSNAVNASWVLAEEVAGGSNATVTLSWPAALEMTGFTRSLSRLAHYTGSGWDYGNSDIAATGTNPYTISRAGFTGMGTFAVSSFGALPVEWHSISAKHENGHNIISWSTSQEVNNEVYVVESSSNGSQFNEIGRVSAIGNTNSLTHYTFVDKNVVANKTLYRVRQIDTDGKFTYSKTVSVTFERDRWIVSNLNNSFNNTLNLDIQSSVMTEVRISLIDVAGRLRLVENRKISKGLNHISIDGSQFSAGVYLLSINDANGTIKTIKLQKK